MKSKLYKYTALAFLANFIISTAMLLGVYNTVKNRLEYEAQSYGINIASTIQLAITQSLEATQMLKNHYLEYGESFLPHFDSVSAKLMAEDPCIGSLYFAPKGVLRYAYPDEVKASTIGFEMFKDPDQAEKAWKAFYTREITVAGPHKLVEGGSGFVIRNPIFEKDGEFVGFTICVMNWDKMVAKTLSSIAKSDNFAIGVWKYDDAHVVTDKNGYIFTTGNVSKERKLDILVKVPNDTWHLTVEHKDKNVLLWEMLPYILYYFLCLACLTGAVYFGLKKMYRNREVELQAVEAKDAFFANISHDIRTPINGIIGMVAIAQKHRDDKERVDDCLDKINTATNHLLVLINDILDIRRIETGKLELDPKNVNIFEVCESCVNVIQGQTQKHNLELVTEFDNFIKPFVIVDERLLRQILINILGNAAKFTPSGGKIVFRANQRVLDDGKVQNHIEIEDNGIGMSEEFQKKIWDAFAQEDGKRVNSVQQGTGLGMTIVKNLISLMGGTISLKSKQGEGSCFTIDLPLEVSNEAEQVAAEQKMKPDVRGLRVLLVEDNPLNMEIAKELLEDQGCIITTAENGKLALDIFQEKPANSFDVVLMDVMMPVMGGIEATKALRALDREDATTVPIIALSANAFKEDIDKSKLAGFNSYLTKPLNLDLLIETIAKLTKK